MSAQAIRFASMSAFALSALALSACGMAPQDELAQTGLPGVETSPVPCGAEICLSEGALERALEARNALEACAPADDDFENDPSGLRILDVSVEARGPEGGLTLKVQLANLSSRGVYSYPGTRLRNLTNGGAVTLGGGIPGEPGAAEFPLYGIQPCDVFDTTFEVVWVEGDEAQLIAEATNELGKSTIDTLGFILHRR